MIIDKIKETFEIDEDQIVEFRPECQDIETIGQEICGFLNTTGGYIICCTEDREKSYDRITSESKINSIEQNLERNLSPKALVSIQARQIEGREYLIIEVLKGQDQPYAFRNIVYLRRGNKTEKAEIEIIRDIILRRQVEPERWERRFSSVDTLEDLDIKEIQSTIKSVVEFGRLQFRNTEDIISVLEDLGVSKYGQLTNGGDVLFGKNPAIRNPQTRVQAAFFSADKSSDKYEDMKSLEGPLVSLLDEVYNFILRNTRTISRFTDLSIERQDESLYPPRAIREGLVNAFAHRDYSDFSGGIAVHVYPDRIDIWNSAKFPEGMTLEKIFEKKLSVLRNPDITHVLFLRGRMDKVGRGNVKIRELCKNHDMPQPQWKQDDFGVTLSLFAPIYPNQLKNQALEYQELKNQALEHQELKNQALEHQELKNQALEHQELKNQALEYQELKNQALEYQELKNQALEHQELKNQALEHQELKNQALEHQELKNQALEHQELKNQALEHQEYVSSKVSKKLTELLEILLNGEMSREELQIHFKLKDPENFRKRYLRRAIEKKFIEMTSKSKHDTNQKYRLTDYGRDYLIKKR